MYIQPFKGKQIVINPFIVEIIVPIHGAFLGIKVGRRFGDNF
jgi:hypothetical protein